MSGWLFDYSFGCQPVDYSNSPKALRVCTQRFLILTNMNFFLPSQSKINSFKPIIVT